MDNNDKDHKRRLLAVLSGEKRKNKDAVFIQDE